MTHTENRSSVATIANSGLQRLDWRLEHTSALRGSDFTDYERHSCDGLALLSARSLATLLSFQLLIIAGLGFSGFSLLSFAFLLASLPPPLRWCACAIAPLA